MPFGRPSICPDSLEKDYEPASTSIASGGNYNAGVFIVRRRLDGKKFVQKRMKPKDIIEGSAEFEMFIHRGLKHRNIVNYLDAFIVDDGRHTPKASLYGILPARNSGRIHSESRPSPWARQTRPPHRRSLHLEHL